MSDDDQHRPLAGDRPIESADQDTIGRSGFASQIRDEIESAPRDEGLVIAVTGDWGSGKTSVINLALNPLEGRAGFRVVRFNPWLFSGTDQLVAHFFVELRTQLKASGNHQLKAVGASLEHYASRLEPLRFIPVVGKVSQLASFVGQIFKGPEASAERQRQKINRLLANQDELLIIVIDDIDRLQDHEIADVMRLPTRR